MSSYWSREKKAVFAQLSPHAVCLVATDNRVRLTEWAANGAAVLDIGGGNRLAWPMKIATTASWIDTISKNYRTGPALRAGVRFRLWLPSKAAAEMVAARMATRLAVLSDDGPALLSGFQDVGEGRNGTHTDIGERVPPRVLPSVAWAIWRDGSEPSQG